MCMRGVEGQRGEGGGGGGGRRGILDPSLPIATIKHTIKNPLHLLPPLPLRLPQHIPINLPINELWQRTCSVVVVLGQGRITTIIRDPAPHNRHAPEHGPQLMQRRIQRHEGAEHITAAVVVAPERGEVVEARELLVGRVAVGLAEQAAGEGVGAGDFGAEADEFGEVVGAGGAGS